MRLARKTVRNRMVIDLTMYFIVPIVVSLDHDPGDSKALPHASIVSWNGRFD